jgi:hypothetical protein
MASIASRDRITWALVAIGIALRLGQVAGGASLWLDEVALARNIAERGYADLLRPLDYAQVAPFGFLMAERFFWSLFHTDWSLRIVPLAGAIASLFLFWALARRVVNGIAVPLSVGMLAIALPHVLFAGQVKQYSTDVTWALALLLVSVRLVQTTDRSRSDYLIAGLLGLVAVWFSNSAVFVVTGLGVALAVVALLNPAVDRRRLALLVLLPWVVAAGAAALAARHGVSPRTMAFMKEFWYQSFAPVPPRSRADLLWPWNRFTDLFGIPWGFRYRFSAVYSVLTLGGLVALWRTRRDTALLLLGPLAVTAAMAVAHVYPFEGRLVLFLTPVLLLAIAAAVQALATVAARYSRVVAVALPIAVALPAVERIVVDRPPYRLQEMRTLLDWLAPRQRPGDVLYVWYRAVPNVAWYAPASGISKESIVEGGCWKTQPREFFRDLDRMRGKQRVWIVLTGNGLPDARSMLAYADTIGRRGEGLAMPSSFPRYHLEAWLYDFSDSTRLASTTWDRFPIRKMDQDKAEVMACSAFFQKETR